MLKRDAIIMLGGSRLQMPIFELAKTIGFAVILIDEFFGCRLKHMSDEFINVSCSDTKKILELISPLKKNYNIKGAYCGNDFGLFTVANINYELGIAPDISKNTLTSLDKIATKKILNDHCIPTPQHWIDNNAKNIFEKDYPVVVKPVDSSGSRGVSFVSDNKLLENAIDKALRFGKNALIEKAIIGRHFDVSGYFADGKFYPAGQLERFFTAPPDCTPTWGYQPPLIDKDQYEENYILLESAARALGIEFGPVKADIISNDIGAYVIEVTPRFHGEISTFYVANKVYDYNVIEAWFQFLKSGMINDLNNFSDPKRYCGWKSLFADKVGNFSKLDIGQISYDMEIIQTKPIGSKIIDINSNLGVVGFLVASGASKAEVQKILSDSLDEVKMWFE